MSLISLPSCFTHTCPIVILTLIALPSHANSAQPQLRGRGVIVATDFEDELVLLEEQYEEAMMEYVPSENEFTENYDNSNAHYGIHNAHARVHQKILNAHDRVQKKFGGANQNQWIARAKKRAAARLTRQKARVQKKSGSAQTNARAQKRAAARNARKQARAAKKNQIGHQKTVSHTSAQNVHTSQTNRCHTLYNGKCVDGVCMNCPNGCNVLFNLNGKKCCKACSK